MWFNQYTMIMGSVLLMSIVCSPVSLAQSSKPLAAIAPVAAIGKISQGQQSILLNTLQDQLEDTFQLVSQKQFREAQDIAYESLDSEQCTEEQCIRRVQEILQVEYLFILQIIREEGDTQLSLTRVGLETKNIETEYCESCKTRELNRRISRLVQKVVAKVSTLEPTKTAPTTLPQKTVAANRIKPKINSEMMPPESIQKGMVRIKKGSFQMGDLLKVGGADELPAHRVTLKEFYISDHEVTTAEYQACVQGGGCTYQGLTRGERRTYEVLGKENHPMNYVSWEDTKSFILWLNQFSEQTTYRLCTEAEWEYAARAGSQTLWSCGNKELCLKEVAWYNTPTSHSVKTKKPNAFGLYDLHGNVWEWVSDWYQVDYYGRSTRISNPKGPQSGTHRVRRGGFFNNASDNLRSSKRSYSAPSARDYYLGFRLCAD